MWFRNGTGAGIREMYGITGEGQIWRPYATLVRPFRPRILGIEGEEEIKQIIADACTGEFPIPFCLSGLDVFKNEEEIPYIPVVRGQQLLRFSDMLEDRIAPKVDFVAKIESEKHLHVTLPREAIIQPFPETNFHMLRLTAIRKINHDKIIWFSYDLVTQKMLNREESKDETRWHETVELFKSTKC
jgi:hypothetical protein